MEKKNYLQEFIVYREVNKPVTTEEVRDGETIKVTVEKKTKEPVKFRLKKPTRKLYEGADFNYGVELSKGIRSGLLTKALLLKRYNNDGGPFSKDEDNYWTELRNQLYSIESQIQRLRMQENENISEEEKEKNEAVLMELRKEVLEQLQAIDKEYESLFEHTAEANAKNRTTYWWLHQMTQWDKDDNGNFVDFFEGDNEEEKQASYDKYDEQNDEFINRCINKALYFVSFWVGGATEEDLIEAENQLINYEAQEEKEKAEASIKEKAIKKTVKKEDEKKNEEENGKKEESSDKEEESIEVKTPEEKKIKKTRKTKVKAEVDENGS